MKIFIVQQRNWALRVGIPLVNYIHEKDPSIRFSGLVYKIPVWKHIHKTGHADLYDDLVLGYKYDDYVNDDQISPQLDAISIEEVEKELEVGSIWKDIAYVDRSLVYTPGKKWRFLFRKQISDDLIIKIIKLNFLLVRDRIFGDNPPDIIFMPLFGSLFHNVLYHFAKAKGVKCWIVNTVKLHDRYVLTSSKMYDLSDVFDSRSSPTESDFEAAREFVQRFRENPLPPENCIGRRLPTQLPLKAYLNAFLRLPGKAVKQYFRNRSSLNPSVYRVLDNITAYQTFKGGLLNILFSAITLKMVDYDELPSKKFLYFPLHVVPEVSTNLWAPEYTNQVDVIRRIAISLPSTVVLVVKEHPVMIGRRDPEFYKDVLGTPNVKLVDPSISSLDILQLDNCLGSTVISGTVGFESVLFGKVSFVLSRMYYRNLPNCHYVRPEEITKDKIESALSISKNKIDDELINFVAKLYAVSFQSKYASVWGMGKNENIDQVYENFYKKIEELTGGNK